MTTSSRPFFFSSRRRHTRCSRDWSSDVCSSDLVLGLAGLQPARAGDRRLAVLVAALATGGFAFTLYLTSLELLVLHAICRKPVDRKSTGLNSSHGYISYAVFCLKKKNNNQSITAVLPRS